MSNKKYTHIGNDVNADTWMENNPWARDKPLFSYNDLKKGVDFRLYPSMSAEKMQEFFLRDIRQATFQKAYELIRQKKREELKKQMDELSDRLLFGEDLDQDAGSGERTPVETQREADVLFAEFRIRLFWWYLEQVEASDTEIDLTKAVEMVNSVASCLGDPSRKPTIKSKDDGTDQSRAGCADC